MAQACYYPDGSLAPDQFRCTTDTAESFCCPDNENCLANKLCYFNSTGFDDVFRHFYFRGSCTDQSWDSPDCPNYCTESSDGRDLAWQCGDDENKYHCLLNLNEYQDGGDNAEQGCSGPSAFTIEGPSSIIPWPSSTQEPSSTRTTEQTGLETDIVRETTSETLRSTSTEAGSTSTDVRSTTNTVSTTGASSVSGTPFAGQSPDTADSSNFSTGVGVGIGVGVGLFLLLGLAAMIFFWRRRRQPKSPNKVNPDEASLSSVDSITHTNMAWGAQHHEAPDTGKQEISGDSMILEAPSDAQKYEAPDYTQIHEIGGNVKRYELPG
ncbi:hypothetical protein B0I35DRAFT_509887 [Stachybotrys elegans]|uniref:Mid2 domain-containing protein n=1 Tax=Stachybotrys elegans TaxID=80388 RepID=A0A8K0SZJ6_9HYPO|nr:hypothetical protein B0I35DRAFT_509887 [Stachybotrys elegans]